MLFRYSDSNSFRLQKNSEPFKFQEVRKKKKKKGQTPPYINPPNILIPVKQVIVHTNKESKC